MSNYSGDDLHRSLRRYVSLVLIEPWKVRTEKQPVADDQRPVCVVEPSAPTATGKLHRATIPQGNVEKLGAFSIMAYPVLGASASESRLTAQAVADLLDDVFTLGIVEGEGAEQVSIGGPFHLPVYDYHGIPVKGSGRAGPADPYGYARVDDLTVRTLQDPIDYLRFTVACDVRLSWERGGRIPQAAPTAKEIRGSFAPSP